MTSNTNHLGFTLVELLIVVAIIGILASVAYPSYVVHVAHSNRAEAQRELVRIANLQEQYFVDHRTYTDDMTKLGLNKDAYVTDSKNYKIDAVVKNNGTTYVLTATAKNEQATNDAACKKLKITETGRRFGTSGDCWEN